MYITRSLVWFFEVWNSTRKKSYACLSFVMISDVLYPLFCSWCGVESTGFVTDLLFLRLCGQKNWSCIDLKLFSLFEAATQALTYPSWVSIDSVCIMLTIESMNYLYVRFLYMKFLPQFWDIWESLLYFWTIIWNRLARKRHFDFTRIVCI